MFNVIKGINIQAGKKIFHYSALKNLKFSGFFNLQKFNFSNLIDNTYIQDNNNDLCKNKIK